MSLSTALRRVPLVAAATVAAGALAASPALAKTLYVSTKGHDTSPACAKKRPCRTIEAGVAKAHVGDTIRVAPGTYNETISITRRFHLVGVHHPIINAKGFGNGFLISGAKAAGASVRGFVVENANYEGLLLQRASHITVAGNVVRSNDQGMFAEKPTGECAANGPIPGDCGEGLHLMSSSNDRIIGNKVHGNAGGILLTDEVGPTHDNTLRGNVVSHNAYDCGITIAGHSPKAYVDGKLQPTKAGIFRNLILGNTANGNGLKGQGAGILIAAGAPGAAVYDNTVQGNTANGNGLGGFTLHSHAPDQDLNGNRIIGNYFAHDAIDGMPGGKPGDVDIQPNPPTKTIGIIVFSAATPLKGIVISGNHLANEYYGIWTKNVPKLKAKNVFAKSVKVHAHQS